MNPVSQLSELQLDILRVLWERRRATVAQVHAALERERGLAVTTVATILSRMEKKHLVGHTRDGRQFVYQPRVSEAELRADMVSELTDRVFHGDVTALVSHLLGSGALAEDELPRVKALIEARERQVRPGKGEDAGGTGGSATRRRPSTRESDDDE